MKNKLLPTLILIVSLGFTVDLIAQDSTNIHKRAKYISLSTGLLNWQGDYFKDYYGTNFIPQVSFSFHGGFKTPGTFFFVEGSVGWLNKDLEKQHYLTGEKIGGTGEALKLSIKLGYERFMKFENHLLGLRAGVLFAKTRNDVKYNDGSDYHEKGSGMESIFGGLDYTYMIDESWGVSGQADYHFSVYELFNQKLLGDAVGQGGYVFLVSIKKFW